MLIRQETSNDYEKVYYVVKQAFASAEHSDGNEQDLVVALRNSSNFIPELSLVAIKDNKIVGYILFTKIKIGEYEELALAPLGILPKYQKQGIGRIGNIKPEMTFIEFSKFVKNKLGLDSMRITGDENKIVKRCALCTGAGTDFFNIAKSKGADVYITGDVKFHEAQKALSMGLCLIDGTHYATENIAVPVMAEYVKNAVENKGEKVEIIISKFNGQTFKNI